MVLPGEELTALKASSMSGVLYISRISSFDQLVLGAKVLLASCNAEERPEAVDAVGANEPRRSSTTVLKKARFFLTDDNLDRVCNDCLGVSEAAIVLGIWGPMVMLKMEVG